MKIHTILFLTFFCLVSVCGKEFRYDLAEMIGNAISNIKAPEYLQLLEKNKQVFSHLNSYSSFITSNRTLELPFIEHLRNVVSSKCAQDLLYVFDSFPGKDMWSIKMLDSYAKFDSGILNGNTKWLGNYQECINVYAPPTSLGGNFHGQYCTLQVTATIGLLPIAFSLGICLPDSCDPNDFILSPIHNEINLQNLNFGNSVANSPVNISVHVQSCQPRTKEFTNAAIGMIALLSILIFTAAVASFVTVFEIYFSKKKPDVLPIFEDVENSSRNNLSEKPRSPSVAEEALLKEQQRSTSSGWWNNLASFLNCFCVFTNGAKLLNTSNTEGQLLCINGIRFLSMCWVMVCHTYAFAATGNSVNNQAEILELIDNLPFQVISNGYFSVDSFFFLSGFLMAYLYFQEIGNTDGKVPWLYFYIHRYLRLTPVYMIVLGTYTALFYYMGDGPSYQLNQIDPLCQENWWYNLLYINNFQSMGIQCIGWSWYLANDMQFFAISPLFLITLRRCPKVGFGLLGLFLCAHFAANFGITYHYDLISGLQFDNVNILDFMIKWQMFMDKIYTRPYTRIGPYLVGIALGYYLNYRKQNNIGKHRKSVMVVGWLVSTAVVLTCQFVLYHNNMSTVACAFYNAFSRVCFGLGLAWIIFACLTEQGGPVNKLLSYKLFIPLSRLTYCAYLIHPVVMYWYFASMRTTITFSHITMVYTFFAFLVVTYFFALLTSLLFESPVIRMEKLIRNKFSTSA